MDRGNAENFQFKGWAAQSRHDLKPELPMIAEWDRLLQQLGLNDLQALEAVKSDGEVSERLRRFVGRAFRHLFVPEVVIEAVRHCRIEEFIVPMTDESSAANSTAATQ
jgi:hypothetical protein